MSKLVFHESINPKESQHSFKVMFWGHFLILGQWVDSMRGLQTSVQIIQGPSLHVLCRPNCAPLELSLALGWDSLWLPGHSAGWAGWGCPIIATSLKFENAPVMDPGNVILGNQRDISL